MIRVLEYRRSSSSSSEDDRAFMPLGWWVGVGQYQGKIYQVDRDRGECHDPWIIKGKNWKKMGLTEEQYQSLANYRLPNFDKTIHRSQEEWNNLFKEANKFIKENWMRTVLHTRGNRLFFDAKDNSQEVHKAVINFIMKLPDHLTEDLIISVYDPHDKAIWGAISFDEAIMSKRF